MFQLDYSGLQIRSLSIFFIMPISSLNPVFDHMLGSSHQDDVNKGSNIRFGKEIAQVESMHRVPQKRSPLFSAKK